MTTPSGTFASEYRRRREELGIPLDVAADATNIRARMLETLESGDFASYPPHGHAIGMLSSYARYLEMDPRPLLERYEAEWGDYEQRSEMAVLADRTRRGVGRYGERVRANEKPVSRETRAANQPKSRSTTRRGSSAGTTARLSEKLSDEQAAEGDDRYRSGSVKVVGTRTSEKERAASGVSRVSSTSTSQASSYPHEHTRSRTRAAAGQDTSHETKRTSRDVGNRHLRGSRHVSQDDEAAASRTQVDGDAASRTMRVRESSRREHDTSSRTPRKRMAPSSRTDETLRPEQREALEYFGGARDAHARPGVLPEEDGAREASRATQTPDDDAPAGRGPVARISRACSTILADTRYRTIALVLAVLVACALIVFCVFLVTSPSGTSGVLDVEGGAQSTSSSESPSDSASRTITTTNGTPVTVVVSVGEGQTSLVSVTYDGDSDYSGTAVGPWERTFLVTESLTATVGNPDAVTITEDGEQVALDVDDDGNGSLTLEVNSVSTNASAESSE